MKKNRKRLKDTALGGLALGLLDGVPLVGGLASRIAGNVGVGGNGKGMSKLRGLIGRKKRGKGYAKDAATQLLEAAAPNLSEALAGGLDSVKNAQSSASRGIIDIIVPDGEPKTDPSPDWWPKLKDWFLENWVYVASGGGAVLLSVVAWFVFKPNHYRKRR